ncbi:hypothetical protein IC620_15190 [Hazenella sp. IB182357]|uniref:Uncharacterized protein n=1 Tax=Polycladospora coralii TaxID=2771432 RepID=A0A926ND94_9BACL|nr:hypothetical protein [Polycladospora coralii]MBD1373690.1 hypothetical protein [Polycladospora coralii]
MELIKELQLISIRGRVAYVTTCVDTLCKRWEIKSFTMNKFINEMKNFTHTINIEEWDLIIRSYLPDEDTLEDYAFTFGYETLSLDKQQVMFNVFEEFIDVGQGNMYSAYDSEITLEPLMNLIQILQENDIELPDIMPFKKSKATEQDGWGNPVSYEYFQSNE